LRRQKLTFVDPSRDELSKAATRANYTGLDHLWLPRTVLSSDFVVSMPKIKTHHWAGVTLSHEEHVRCRTRDQVRPAEECSDTGKGYIAAFSISAPMARIYFVSADGIITMEAADSCTELIGASARSFSPMI